MTQTTGPEFKGGIHPLFNTIAVQAEAVADPDVNPDFLNPESQAKSIVKPRDPNFKTADQIAFDNSESAWGKYDKQKGVNQHEISNVQPGIAADALAVVKAHDAEVDALIDRESPVFRNGQHVVAHEAQLDLTQQASVAQQAPTQR